jgi:hypothetical protein
MASLSATGTQVAKLGAAARILMSLTLSPDQRMAGAMLELGMGFLENPPYKKDSAVHLARLRALFDGQGSWQAQAARTNPEAREQVSEAFWRLHQSVMAAFYKEMYQPAAPDSEREDNTP